MKKIFFLTSALFIFSSVAVHPAYAEQEFSSEEACAKAGGGAGFCADPSSLFTTDAEKSLITNPLGVFYDDDNCQANQEKLGICSGLTNNSACCKNKDNGPISEYKELDSTSGEEHPLIGTALCQATKAQGGWGGECKSVTLDAFSDACNDSGPDAEDYVGLCDLTSQWNPNTSQCCIPKGTAIQNPTKKNYLSVLVDESYCERSVSDGGMGGKCEAYANEVLGNTIGNTLWEETTCDTAGEVVVAVCEDGGPSSDTENGCCVPKDGEYCKKVEAAGGVCSGGSGADAGTAAALEYGDYQLLESIPGSSNDAADLPTYLQNIYQAGLVLIVIGAIFMIGMGGFTYIASAGNTHTMAKGKGMIKDALYGLIIALATWLILNIINPDLVNLTIDTPSTLNFQAGSGVAEGTVGGGGGSATSSLSAQEAAKKLLTHPNVSLGTDSGNSCPGGNASAKQNLEQVAAGKGMTRCPCGGGGSVAPSETLLNSLVDMAEAGGKFRINYIAGACHSPGSNHYSGSAVDIQRNSTLDSFFAKYPLASSGPTYQVSGVKVFFEDRSHYHVSLTGR